MEIWRNWVKLKFKINVIGGKDRGSIVSLDITEKLDEVTGIYMFGHGGTFWGIDGTYSVVNLTDVPCTRFDDRIPLLYSRRSKMKYVKYWNRRIFSPGNFESIKFWGVPNLVSDDLRREKNYRTIIYCQKRFVLNKHQSFIFHALLSVDLITVKLVGEWIAPLH